MRIPERYNHVTQTRYGTLIYNKNDVCVGRSIELYGEYCERAIVVFDQILSAGQTVIDIGANIGMQTLFFARKVGPAGCVLAFEPQRLVFQALCGNMAINSIANVHCWNAAIGAAEGEIVVPQVDHERTGELSALEIVGMGGGDRVPVIPLDRLGLPRCDLVRMAAPGVEAAILRGAASLLRRLKPVLYINCQNDPQQETELIAQLSEIGYATHWHSAALFDPQNYAGNSEDIFGNQSIRSLLCIDRAVEQQLTGFSQAVTDAA